TTGYRLTGSASQGASQHGGCRVAELEAAGAIGKGRVCRAIFLGLRIGRDRQCGRRDRERVAGEADGVVGSGYQAALADGIGTTSYRLTRSASQGTSEHSGCSVTELEAARAIGKGRVCRAIFLGLRIGRDRQRG